jgi:hypothetical protein
LPSFDFACPCFDFGWPRYGSAVEGEYQSIAAAMPYRGERLRFSAELVGFGRNRVFRTQMFEREGGGGEGGQKWSACVRLGSRNFRKIKKLVLPMSVMEKRQTRRRQKHFGGAGCSHSPRRYRDEAAARWGHHALPKWASVRLCSPLLGFARLFMGGDFRGETAHRAVSTGNPGQPQNWARFGFVRFCSVSLGFLWKGRMEGGWFGFEKPTQKSGCVGFRVGFVGFIRVFMQAPSGGGRGREGGKTDAPSVF